MGECVSHNAAAASTAPRALPTIEWTHVPVGGGHRDTVVGYVTAVGRYRLSAVVERRRGRRRRRKANGRPKRRRDGGAVTRRPHYSSNYLC